MRIHAKGILRSILRSIYVKAILMSICVKAILMSIYVKAILKSILSIQKATDQASVLLQKWYIHFFNIERGVNQETRIQHQRRLLLSLLLKSCTIKR